MHTLLRKEIPTYIIREEMQTPIREEMHTPVREINELNNQQGKSIL
jgi:hypothetical protein